jgi:hypothetical protein
LERDAYELLEVRRLNMAQDREHPASSARSPSAAPRSSFRRSAKWAFLALVIVMVLFAAGAWFALKRMHDREL